MRLIAFWQAIMLLRLALIEVAVATVFDRWAEAAMHRSRQRMADAHAIADRIGLTR